MSERKSPLEVAKKIKEEKYPGAMFLILASSILRGEGTRFSDLDLVVVFENLEKGYRESYYFDGYPVEAFVHDPQTIRYFFEVADVPSGRPSLPQMVAEGILVPEGQKMAAQIKNDANAILSAGPLPLSNDEIKEKCYMINDLVDDIREPRTLAELYGSLTRLYEALGDFHLRANDQWSGQGKWLPKLLTRFNPVFANHFQAAFEEAFKSGYTKSLVDLSEEITRPFGGLVFAGFRRDAPAAWRK